VTTTFCLAGEQAIGSQPPTLLASDTNPIVGGAVDRPGRAGIHADLQAAVVGVTRQEQLNEPLPDTGRVAADRGVQRRLRRRRAWL